MAENDDREKGLKPAQPVRIRSDDFSAAKGEPAARAAADSTAKGAPVVRLKLIKTLEVLNQMQAAGVIGRYAIGGAVGATFYLEPVRTLDVDVFVAIHPEPGQLMVTIRPIYDYLTARGCTSEGEYLIIEGWPVQFLPPSGLLVEEAIAEAREVEVAETGVREKVRTFVFTAEHLVAIALQTGRAKDKARILQFMEAGKLDQERLRGILNRHGLFERWTRFEQHFFGEES